MTDKTISIPTMFFIVVAGGLLNESTRSHSLALFASMFFSCLLIIAASFFNKRAVVFVAIPCIAWLLYGFWWFLLAMFS
jgi:hypothetical protein